MQAALFNVMPAAFSTIAYISAYQYFTSPGTDKPSYVIGLSWGR